jgi:hypothetical protein
VCCWRAGPAPRERSGLEEGETQVHAISHPKYRNQQSCAAKQRELLEDRDFERRSSWKSARKNFHEGSHLSPNIFAKNSARRKGVRIIQFFDITTPLGANARSADYLLGMVALTENSGLSGRASKGRLKSNFRCQF